MQAAETDPSWIFSKALVWSKQLRHPRGCLSCAVLHKHYNHCHPASSTSRNAYNLHMRRVARQTPILHPQCAQRCVTWREREVPRALLLPTVLRSWEDKTLNLHINLVHLQRAYHLSRKMSHLNTIGNTQNDALTVFIDTSMRQAVTLPTVHTQHQTVLCTKMMPPS